MKIGFEHVVIWVAVYILGVTALKYILKRYDRFPNSISITGPILTTHSQHGLNIIEKLSNRFKRFWSYWGYLGVFFAVLGILLGLVLFIPSAFAILFDGGPTSTAIDDPKNYLVIPGVNDFLPLAAMVELLLALVIGMVVHEGGHAIMCRVADIEIDSTGIALFALIPLGAFVQPDEESQAKASPTDRLKMFAGGIMNNIAISLIAFVLLVGPLLALVAPVPGAAVNGVFAGSPADESDLQKGDVITEINGQSITTAEDAENLLANTTEDNFSITLKNGTEKTISREVFITSAPTTFSDIETGDTISKINNSSVKTVSEFKKAISEVNTTTTITLKNGSTISFTPGALVQPTEGYEPRSQIGAENVVLTHIDGTRVHSSESLVAELQNKNAEETINYTVYSDGEFKTYTATLSEDGKLGVQVFEGVSGLEATDFGAKYYPKEQVLTLLSGGSLVQSLVSILILPFWSLFGNAFNFPGFIPSIANFYTVTAVPAALEGIWLFTASLSFWTVWLNLNLAFFNCLPTYPLDGGHIAREGMKILSNKAGVNEQITQIVTYTILSLMFLAIAFVFLAPAIF